MSRKMKGVELPVNALVIITIAVIFLIIAIGFLGGLPGIGQQQTRTGALASCCTAYSLSGQCGQDNVDFECNVPVDFDTDGTTDGKLSISQLGQDAGITDYETFCKCG